MKEYIRVVLILELWLDSEWFLLYFLVVCLDREIIKVWIVFDVLVKVNEKSFNIEVLLGLKL